MRRFIISSLFALSLLILIMMSYGCDRLTDPDKSTKSDLISLSIIPPGVDIDGGVLSYQVGKSKDTDNNDIDHFIQIQIGFDYSDWEGNIDVRLDDTSVTKSIQRILLNPFDQHIWEVTEDQQNGIPNINKTIPAIEPLEITSPDMFENISLPASLVWSTPQNNESEVMIIISRINMDTTGFDEKMVVIPTDDDGSYSLTQNDLSDYNEGDTLQLKINRVWSDIDTLDNKTYLFLTNFANNVIVIY